MDGFGGAEHAGAVGGLPAAHDGFGFGEPGVPVVSLAGRTAVSRAGSTLLSNVGLEHLVARSDEQYVERAAELIRDQGGLAELRRGLRDRLEASPVMNARQFGRDFEAALRTAWRAWCVRRA